MTEVSIKQLQHTFSLHLFNTGIRTYTQLLLYRFTKHTASSVIVCIKLQNIWRKDRLVRSRILQQSLPLSSGAKSFDSHRANVVNFRDKVFQRVRRGALLWLDRVNGSFMLYTLLKTTWFVNKEMHTRQSKNKQQKNNNNTTLNHTNKNLRWYTYASFNSESQADVNQSSTREK